ncbi:MAG: hypothetical protein Q8P45_00040 [Candidatus Harrisonbacteria bacterium]|nr:hypothetical protein [Candidatus Harrisonbacteria bacterium]
MKSSLFLLFVLLPSSALAANNAQVKNYVQVQVDAGTNGWAKSEINIRENINGQLRSFHFATSSAGSLEFRQEFQNEKKIEETINFRPIIKAQQGTTSSSTPHIETENNILQQIINFLTSLFS